MNKITITLDESEWSNLLEHCNHTFENESPADKDMLYDTIQKIENMLQ